MEPNKRLFIAFSITMILVVAIFTSIGRSLIAISTPSIVLPSLSTPSTDSHGQVGDSSLYRVEVTPSTVQSVIQSLKPRKNYHRTLETTLHWQEGATSTIAEVWHLEGLTQTSKTLPSTLIRHDMILDIEALPPSSQLYTSLQEEHTLESFAYYWYDNANTYLSQPFHNYSADLAQRIPTYQTVLDLEVTAIHQATYQTKEGIPCIFVEATPPPLYYTERYWVSTETGLLIASETYEGDKLIYTMTGYSPITSPLPDTFTFSLPDGTAIHQEQLLPQDEP